MNFDTPMVPLAFSVNEMLGTFFCISMSSQQQCLGAQSLKTHQAFLGIF